MKVRKVTRKTKQAADYTFVKAYHGKTFTKETYEIKKVEKRGDNYLYQLKDGTNKFYRRDRISENTPAADPDSNERIKSNRKNIAPPTPPPSPAGVKTRAAKKKDQAAKAKDKLEEKESEVKKPDKKEESKAKPEKKKESKPKPEKKKEPESNVVEEHSKEVLKKAPGYHSLEEVRRVIKWLSYQSPKSAIIKKHKRHDEDPTLSTWHYVSKKDSDFVDEHYNKVDKFLKYMRKEENFVKKWKVWVDNRTKELKEINDDLNFMPGAEYYGEKPTWRYADNLKLRGYKVGDFPKKVPYAKGSQ